MSSFHQPAIGIQVFLQIQSLVGHFSGEVETRKPKLSSKEVGGSSWPVALACFANIEHSLIAEMKSLF